MIYEIIEKINNMQYTKNVINRIKDILPNNWSIKQSEANEIVEELWIIYDDNNVPVIDVIIEEDITNYDKLIITAQPC